MYWFGHKFLCAHLYGYNMCAFLFKEEVTLDRGSWSLSYHTDCIEVTAGYISVFEGTAIYSDEWGEITKQEIKGKKFTSSFCVSLKLKYIKYKNRK